MNPTNDKRFTESLLFKALCVALLLSLVIFSLIFFKDLLKPVALGILLWYLIKAFNGLTDKIKFRGQPLNHWFRRVLALLVIVAIVELTIQLFVTNISELLTHYSAYQSTLNSLIISTGEKLGMENVTESLNSKIGELDIQGFLREALTAASSIVGNLLLVIIYAIFILLEEHSFHTKMALVLKKPGHANKIKFVLDQIYASTNKYVAVKAFVSALTGILSYVVLIVVGVDFAFLWAMLIFILNFIPYIGSVIATLLPAIFSIVQFGSLWPFVWVFFPILILQNIIGNYLEPKIMGKSLNLSPLVVVLSLAFWGFVWDLLGMFLAVPIMSILLIACAQFPSTRVIAIWLTEKGDIGGLQLKDE